MYISLVPQNPCPIAPGGSLNPFCIASSNSNLKRAPGPPEHRGIKFEIINFTSLPEIYISLVFYLGIITVVVITNQIDFYNILEVVCQRM